MDKKAVVAELALKFSPYAPVRPLCPQKALGIDVQMPGGVGILVPDPLKDPADFEARIPKEVDVKDKLSHVIQAVVRIKEVSFVRPLQPCLKPFVLV